jgi:8-oxo-dGTP pyrophosphatase MutT (NUDIX family)
LREAQEEVGLIPSQVEILGRLPEYRTGTGFVITPVVGLVTPPLNLKLDDFEVAEVFEPPLDFLLNSANHQRHSIEVRGVMREYWAMPWQGYYIWGATAGMLVALHRVLQSGS